MRLAIGRLAPAVLFLIFVVELGLRFVPANHVARRGWEATRASGQGSFFLPNRSYENPRSFGDLSNAGNLPARREYRRDVFTTDRFGYRNPPQLLAGTQPAAMILGSSFSAGAGNADEDMLSAQLTRRTGMPVYNAAARSGTDPEEWLEIARTIGLERGWVIYEHRNRDLPGGRTRKAGWSARLRTRYPETWEFIRWAKSHPLSISPLKIWLSRGLRRIENGTLLPNSFAKEAVERRLNDGSWMLFLPPSGEPGAREAEANADAWRDHLVERAEVLSKHGHRLLVLLLPTKIELYGPLLENPTPSSDTAFASLARLEDGLRRSGVAVVNLAPVFREEAKARLARGETIYWRDDTHWNPAGIRIAAEAVAAVLK